MRSITQIRWRLVGRLLTIGLALSLAGLGCSDDSDGSSDPVENNEPGADAEQPDVEESDADESDAEPTPDVEEPGEEFVQVDCDELQPTQCALPWPSNAFLKPDDSRATGYTLSFGEETLPKSDLGIQTRPDPWERLDGYGLGSALLLHYPDLDISEMAGEESVGRSMEEDAAVVWLEIAEDGSVARKIPYFVEFDTRRMTKKPEQTLLYVRPAVILNLSTRYVVAFRNLKNEDGSEVERSEAFEKLLSGDTADDPALASRQARFDEIFEILDGAGIDKDELTIAWDFVTGSSEALHGPMLSMRDQGMELAGESGPELKITDIVENDESEADKWWLEIKGTFESPHFMQFSEIDGTMGWTFNLDDEGKPLADGTHKNTFWLYVPQSARDGSAHGLLQYGHGLLGTGGQTGGGHNRTIANEHKFIVFGTTLVGMSDEDLPSAAFALQDLNGFPFVGDRLHQGLLEFLLLARSMRERLADVDEIASRNINVNSDELYYSGISQGGIFGGTYLALSTDITQGHLGVPGNNYSTLLHRSVDFDLYAAMLNTAYTNTANQVVALTALQLLWDQTDPVSYLRHITSEPFADTPKHYALFAPAKGDFQVSVMTNEIAARSDMDIQLMEHYGKDVDLVDPQPYPYTGSGVVLYDFGNPWPEAGNHPHTDDLGDPHNKPRNEAHHNEQMVHFFRNGGEIIDVCNGSPCTPD